MTYKRYLELSCDELARLENALTCINLAVPSRQRMIIAGDYQRRIANQRQLIRIVEEAMRIPA